MKMLTIEEKQRMLLEASFLGVESIKTSVSVMIMAEYLFRITKVYLNFVDDESGQIMIDALSGLDPEDSAGSMETILKIREAYEKTSEQEHDALSNNQLKAHIIALKMYISDMLTLYQRNIDTKDIDRIVSIITNRDNENSPSIFNILYAAREDIEQHIEL